MTLVQLMALADDYAEALSDNSYQQNQGTRQDQVEAAYQRCQITRAALYTALQSAIPTPADTGPIIP